MPLYNAEVHIYQTLHLKIRAKSKKEAERIAEYGGLCHNAVEEIIEDSYDERAVVDSVERVEE